MSAPATTVEVRSDGDVLRLALEEVLENALEHTGRDEPSVALAVGSTSSSVSIRVRDDGSVIQERERAVLTEREETTMRHGSGVGLWLVYWAVTRPGGELEFTENEPRGSVVEIRIPDRTPAGESERESTV